MKRNPRCKWRVTVKKFPTERGPHVIDLGDFPSEKAALRAADRVVRYGWHAIPTSDMIVEDITSIKEVTVEPIER